MPMEKAQEYCKRNFSHLVSITSDSERRFLWRYVFYNRREYVYYIGLRLGLDKKFKWTDGSPVHFVAWASGQPDFSNDDESCAVMTSGWGNWNDINCGSSKPFICERTNSSIHGTFAPTIPAPDGGCPSDWLSFGQMCYGIFDTEDDEGVNWDTARRACWSSGGNLVTINNDLVQSFLMSNLINVKVDVWIGLHDKNREHKFVWTDESGLFYTNWAKYEPHSFRSQSTDCVALKYGTIRDAGTWIVHSCFRHKGYICQKSKDPSLPVISTTPPAHNRYKYGDATYKFDKTKRNWDEARQECLKDNSQLASILDEYTTSFLKLHLAKHKEPFWIGLYSRNETKKTYKWVDDCKIDYTKWAAKEPSKDNSCVYVDTDGQWKTSSCNETYSSICKQKNVVTPTVLPESPGTCPNTTTQAWIPFRNHCYLFESSSSSWWHESTVKCQYYGATLTSIEDSTESKFLLRHTKPLRYQQEGFWIGLYMNAEGKGLWLDNTPLDFVNWNNKVPYGDVSSMCVMMDARKGTWEITHCTRSLGYICKTLKTPLPTEKSIEKEEKPSHGLTIGVVVLVILVLAGAAIAAFFVYRRKRNNPQPENGFSRIYYDSSQTTETQEANVLLENIDQPKHTNS